MPRRQGSDYGGCPQAQVLCRPASPVCKDVDMVRYAILGAFVAGGLILIGPLLTGKADPADKAIRTQLAIQQALDQAKQLRAKNENAKAVELLEEHLPRINGNAIYLDLLRDSYRAHIRDLLAQKQAPLAEKYRERLKIIDRSADADASLRFAFEEQYDFLCIGASPFDCHGVGLAGWRVYFRPAPERPQRRITSAFYTTAVQEAVPTRVEPLCGGRRPRPRPPARD